MVIGMGFDTKRKKISGFKSRKSKFIYLNISISKNMSGLWLTGRFISTKLKNLTSV